MPVPVEDPDGVLSRTNAPASARVTQNAWAVLIPAYLRRCVMATTSEMTVMFLPGFSGTRIFGSPTSRIVCVSLSSPVRSTTRS